MSDYCQWVASSSSHVVLDGVPFKIADSFRVAPVVASTEDKLYLRSQSSCLKDEYVFDREKEYVHWYKSLLSLREAEQEKRKSQAAAAAAAAAATTASANATAADAAVPIRDGSAAGATWLPSRLKAGDADAAAGDDADIGSRHDFRDSSSHRHPAPLVVPPKPKHAALPPGLGHDLLLPKPAVPRKPLLSGGAATTAIGSSAAAPPSSLSFPTNSSASLPQLDLALFEREEDVFDKMQMKTLNDLEELKSVLLPTHGTRLVAADGQSAGDASRTDGLSPRGVASGAVSAAAAITVEHASSRNSVDEDEARHLLNSANFGLTVPCGRSGGGSSSVYSPNSRSFANGVGAVLPEIVTTTVGVVSSDVMSAASPGTGQAVLAESRSSSSDGIASGRYSPATSLAAPATSSSAVAAAAATVPPPEEPVAAAQSRPVHQRKAPVVPPRRSNSTDSASSAPDVLASVALVAGQLRTAAAATEATATAAAATADGSARPVRPAPPPPPKPTPVANGIKPRPLQSRHSAAACLPAVSAPKPFSYTAAADGSGLSPRLPSSATSQANASTGVKNIVWPDLLSSPEPHSTIAATGSSSAFASGLPAAHLTLSHTACNGETAAAAGKRSPLSATGSVDLSNRGATSNAARDDVAGDDDLTSKLVAMGFPSRHVESALRHFGKDDKKAVEHLCILSDLVDKGHDWRIAQTAILTYPDKLGKVEEYLTAYKRLLEYGFEGEKIQQALATYDANAEKALDMLAGAASS